MGRQAGDMGRDMVLVGKLSIWTEFAFSVMLSQGHQLGAGGERGGAKTVV